MAFSAVMWVLAVASAAGAEAAPWVDGFQKAPPARVLAAAKAVEPPKRAGVDVLWRDISHTFDREGRKTTVSRLVYRLHTRGAVEGWGSVESSFSPWYENRPVIRARVITPAGKAYMLDPRTLTESSSDDSEQHPLEFREERIVRGPLPAAEPGCVVEEEVVRKDRRPFFTHGTVTYAHLGFAAPTAATRVTVRAPVDLPLTWRVVASEAPVKETREKRERVLRLELGPRKAQAPRHTYLPPEVPYGPMLVVATGRDWNTVAQAYGALVDGAVSARTVAQDARQLAAGSQDPRVLVPRFMAHIRNNVRYAAVEFGDGSIVPRAPAHVLKQRYGDCKDLSTLLVSMLRAADVPAHLALLNAGWGPDVEADMPGLGSFNHAIVYVPGAQPLWVDPTSRFGPSLGLPTSDQGRRALVVAPDTRELVTIPRLPHTDNTYAEERVFHVALHHEGRVDETTRATGDLAADLRATYAPMTATAREQAFKKYAKDGYSGELVSSALPGLEDADAPLELVLKLTKARTVWTGEEEATFNLGAGAAVNQLPRELWPQDKEDEDEEKPEQDPDVEPKAERTVDHVLPMGFVADIRYVLRLPDGMTPDRLPADLERRAGAARLARVSRVVDPRTVEVHYQVDSGPGRFTPAEYKQLKTALADFVKASRQTVTVHHTPQWLIAQGRGEEGYREHQALMAAHPDEPLYREHLARSLLSQGFGEAAREEAARAVEAAPDKATPHLTQAWVLLHDRWGRLNRPGFDRPGAIRAMRRALEITPDDGWTRALLADALTYDDQANRYPPGLDLTESVRLLRSIKEELKQDDQAAFALSVMSRAGRHADVIESARNMPADAHRNRLLAAALAMTAGPQGLDEALAPYVKGAKERQSAAVAGAQELVTAGEYARAAVVLREAATRSASPAGLLSQAGYLERMKPWVMPEGPPTAPGDALRRYVLSFSDPDVPESVSAALVSRMKGCKQDVETRASLHEVSAKQGLPLRVMRDASAATLQFAAEGDAETGWLVRMAAPGAPTQEGFVVMEEGQYRVLNVGVGRTTCMGERALALVEQGKVASAARWLDWARARVPPSDKDDPLAGSPFVLLWNVGDAPQADAVRLAAAALVVRSNEDARPRLVPILQAALKQSRPAVQEAAVRLALMAALAKDTAAQDTHSAAVWRLQPQSETALVLRAYALFGARKFADAGALLAAARKNRKHEKMVRDLSYRMAEWQGDYTKATALLGAMESDGVAEPAQLNNLSWLSLFTHQDLDFAIARMERLTRDPKSHRAHLNTVAALYADAGRTREAVEILRRMYPADSAEEPAPEDVAVWARLAEAQGLNAQARALYGRIALEKDAKPTSVSTWVKIRLDAMNAAPAKAR